MDFNEVYSYYVIYVSLSQYSNFYYSYNFDYYCYNYDYYVDNFDIDHNN